MRIDVLTLFPAMFSGPLTESMIKRASEAGILDIRVHDIRQFAQGRHRQADDKPYGGGAGMVMMAEPIVACMEAVIAQPRSSDSKIADTVDSKIGVKNTPHKIYLSPSGKRLTQSKVEKLAGKHDWLILLCGHYEGVDQRVIDGWIDEEISIGDYVLTGGELPAMVLIDTVARHIPGVLGKEQSAHQESFSKAFGRKKEHPHFTRPEDFLGRKVPDVLLSGDHKRIEKWRLDNLR